MSFRRKLNNVGVAYKSIGDLNVNIPYVILSMDRMNTDYGYSISVTLKGEDGETIRIFLPKRYSEALSVEEISAYKPGNIYF